MSNNHLGSSTNCHIGHCFDFNNRSASYQADSVLLEGTTSVVAVFEHDRNNILRSRAWARLRDIYQFAINYSDPRLTNREIHSINVKDTAEELARLLGLGRESQLLAGNIGLVHDIGHPPFAHWGQLAIKKAIEPHGLNWNHDIASIRILTDWAEDAKDGCNLSPTFIEGIIKRFWQYDQNKQCSFYNHDMAEIPDIVKSIDLTHNNAMKFDGFNHIEGQIAAQSDRLSFNISDLQDGLRIGRFTPEMIKNNFPFAWHILDRTVDQFVTEYKIIDPYNKHSKFLKNIIYKDTDIMGFLYQRFATSFREALIQDLIDNTTANLKNAIDSQLIHNAEDIRNLDHVCVEFSLALNEQFKKFARFCRENIFLATAPFEHLVSSMINDYVNGKVELPQIWQKTFDEAPTVGNKIEIIAKYLTCEITDRDVINHVFKYSPDIYHTYCPPFESILDGNITLDAATKRLTELARKSSRKSIGIPIFLAHDLDFSDDKSIPVISVAKKFILSVPQLGETIQITRNGKYKSGEEFHQGDPLKCENDIISGKGFAFYNCINDQWLAAISGLKNDDRNVIVLNEVTRDQAIQLQKKLDEYGDPDTITMPQLKEILAYAESLGLTNYYPSNVGFINKMMENVPGYENMPASTYGWKQRKGTQICRAIYIEGAGELHQPFGEPEKFYDGALIVKHATGRIHVIAKHVGFRTYYHLDNSAIEKDDIPLQEPYSREKFQTSHVITNDIYSTKIVIVGAGASGILAATYLIQEFLNTTSFGYTLELNIIDSISNPGGYTYNRASPTRVTMANPIGGLGMETSTACIEHINKDPEKWKNIFRDVTYIKDQGFDPQASVTHVQFGEYIRDHLESMIQLLEANKAPVKVKFIRDRVIKSTEDTAACKCVVTIGSGKKIFANAVIYALGNANPKPLIDKDGNTLCGKNGYYNLDDHAFTPENVNETNFTVIVGTGNGACFSALWAVDHGYSGKFLLVSRNGRVPHVANRSKPYTRSICTVEKFVEEANKTITNITADYLMQLFKEEMTVARAAGFEWRDVVDSMFSDTNTLWRAMSQSEQKSFIEKYEAMWSCARYRIPNEQWEQVNKLRREGRLEISGGLQYIEIAMGTGFNLTIKNSDGSIRVVHTTKIVNNTGPSKHLEQMPVCAKEFVLSGLARMYHSGGLDVDDHFRLINAQGEPSPRFYALGPIVSGAHPESITIPAIRCSASIVAKSLIQHHVTTKRNELHYSGYNHRPYDYSTISPDKLSDVFKKTRFAQSLTNICPRHYTEEEKAQFYTVEFAEKALACGRISAPPHKTVLWSGGYIPSHPLGYGLSRIIVERWLVEKNAEVELQSEDNYTCEDLYHTVAMTEAGLPYLNAMWDDSSIPYSVKKQVTPTYILGFAACASGEISLNVDDTDIDSFFRENELEVVMKNANITSVRVIRVNHETDTLHETLYIDRHQWYNAQKDQWVNSIVTRYQMARNSWERDNCHYPLYERMSRSLIDELYDSYTNMTSGNKLIEGFHRAMGHKYEDASQAHDKALEILRLKRFAPLIEVNPDLLNNGKVDKQSFSMALKQF
ncbi:hypothetical protein I4U23_022998 [Adineta vaga]|nr:hypothetical protein I4U23_022998 [Adineta vaga]